MSKEKRPIIVVKKVKGGHGHHGGAWKVAFADFMTAMMAFFLVMWIISMGDDVRGGIEGYFTNPGGLLSGNPGRQTPLGVGASTQGGAQMLPRPLVARQIEERRYQEIAESIEESLRAHEGLGQLATQVEVILTDEGLRIELVEGDDGDLFFEMGSARLQPAATRALMVIGAELSGASAPLVVEGHTDATPYAPGATYTNWELSSDRANAARRALEGAGLGGSRVAEVRGHADRHLRVPEAPHDNSNRRISILLPFTSALETITGGSVS